MDLFGASGPMFTRLLSYFLVSVSVSRVHFLMFVSLWGHLSAKIVLDCCDRFNSKSKAFLRLNLQSKK